MERKTQASYDRVLQVLRDTVLQGVAIDSVMADYEPALRQSVSDTFPNTRLLGRWFHFSKAVFLKGKLLEKLSYHSILYTVRTYYYF